MAHGDLYLSVKIKHWYGVIQVHEPCMHYHISIYSLTHVNRSWLSSLMIVTMIIHIYFEMIIAPKVFNLVQLEYLSAKKGTEIVIYWEAFA